MTSTLAIPVASYIEVCAAAQVSIPRSIIVASLVSTAANFQELEDWESFVNILSLEEAGVALSRAFTHPPDHTALNFS